MSYQAQRIGRGTLGILEGPAKILLSRPALPLSTVNLPQWEKLSYPPGPRPAAPRQAKPPAPINQRPAPAHGRPGPASSPVKTGPCLYLCLPHPLFPGGGRQASLGSGTLRTAGEESAHACVHNLPGTGGSDSGVFSSLRTTVAFSPFLEDRVGFWEDGILIHLPESGPEMGGDSSPQEMLLVPFLPTTETSAPHPEEAWAGRSRCFHAPPDVRDHGLQGDHGRARNPRCTTLPLLTHRTRCLARSRPPTTVGEPRVPQAWLQQLWAAPQRFRRQLTVSFALECHYIRFPSNSFISLLLRTRCIGRLRTDAEMAVSARTQYTWGRQYSPAPESSESVVDS